MRSWQWVLVALGVLCASQRVAAQATQTSMYPLTPQSGAWLICTKSYTESDLIPEPRILAEELATEIRTRYKMNAFIFNRGAEEQERERKRIATIRQQQADFAKQIGQQLTGQPRIKTMRIPDQYAVLVGAWPDMDAARKALDGIRKLPPPSTKLLDATVSTGPDGKGKGQVTISYVNPFQAAFVVPNPTIPKPKDPDEGKPDPIIFELNEGEELSVLRCRKPWTLVVRVYQGGVTMQASQAPSNGSFISRLGFSRGRSENLLTASALQANGMANSLRNVKEVRIESYVMHTRYSSIVCVGQFDRPDDPALLQLQKTLGNFNVGGIDQLMSLPLPMEIPRKK